MNKKDQIFVSYSHDFEKKTGLVQKIEDYCNKHTQFALIRERGRVKTGESFGDYMRKIGRGWCVLLVLSDKYFRSANCINELLEIDRNHGLDERRIIPIICEDYRCDDAQTINSHIDYWKNTEVNFTKEKLSSELIKNACQTNAIIYKNDEAALQQLVEDITTFVDTKRSEEKVQRKKDLKQFKQRQIDEIIKQQKACPDLEQAINLEIENFPPSLEVISSNQLKSFFSSLCIATAGALKKAKKEAVEHNICNSAMQIFNSLIILSFDDTYFINRQICFDGEIRLLYKVPFVSQTLVEGYLAAEYNFPVRLVKNDKNIEHGESDLSEVIGLQNGWGEDDKQQKYEEIHKAVDVIGSFEKSEGCYKEMSDYIAYLREEKITNYYFSVDGKDTTHKFNQSNKIEDVLQENIPEIVIIHYGLAINDEILIMQENDIRFPVHRFFSLVEEYQTHAAN